MLNENIDLFNGRLNIRDKLKINPDILDKLICKKCKVRALVVTDSFLYFNGEDFGLSDFISILETTTHPSAKLIVSKAHRGDPGIERLNGADKDFKFTSNSLANIDVIFMFAAGRNSPLLSATELKALATFMNQGGGVFATGDHDWLGRAMCGDLMRVRSMRKWFYPGTGPFGEPAAPGGSNADRHDTNRPGHNSSFSFDDQSDDIPQEISPIYSVVKFSGLGVIKEPHPILCGTNGVIKHIPDHPHEGECLVPWELDRTFNYDGANFEEYPLDASGQRPLPKVIATASMLPGAEVPESGKPPISGGVFGVMSAYDGHLADVGRVHCDATWHHFININLTGTDSVSNANPKSMGFLASESGEAYFEEIKNYFRNIATWLAPKTKQNCMRNRWLWNIVRQPAFQESFSHKLLENKKLSVIEAARIGQQIIAFPSLNLSKCQIRRWELDLIIPELREPIPDLACLLDPCIPSPNPVGPDPLPFIDPDIFLKSGIGNLAFEMLKESNKLDVEDALQAPDRKQMETMVKSVSKETLKLIGNELEVASKEISKITPMLKII